MQKPIEPGCLVLILRGNMANHVGVAVERVPANQNIERHPERMKSLPKNWSFSCDAWELELSSDPECNWVIAESNLMRIDGVAADQDETEREERHDALAHA